ncbi:unnamed protein product [Paramecium octaurelia]|uniref:Uncharacterized protein n=1 Tax=Paramecium octaurelia TaxID=43137 RepID=A0A8S1Y0H6_PAROT|nr:unnamed protein product [Paramecium octaurelia]
MKKQLFICQKQILGLCLNKNCYKETQYYSKCLTQVHSDHLSDCIEFAIILANINQFLEFGMNHFNKSKKSSII